MKKYRGFSVDVVANGFIASIGCQRLVFKTMEEVSKAIMDYANDPEGAAKKILENSFTDVPQMPEVAAGRAGLTVGGEVCERVDQPR